jgi:hypothetical protein
VTDDRAVAVGAVLALDIRNDLCYEILRERLGVAGKIFGAVLLLDADDDLMRECIVVQIAE